MLAAGAARLGGRQRDRQPRDGHLRLPRRLCLLPRLGRLVGHLQGPTPLLRERAHVLLYVDLTLLLVALLVTTQGLPVGLGPGHVVVVVGVLEVEELEGVAAAIDQVHHHLAGEVADGLPALDPEAGLPPRALAHGLAGGVLVAASLVDVEDLVGDAQGFAGGCDGQAGVADESAVVLAADGPELALEGLTRGEVEVGVVVGDENQSVVVGDGLPGASEVGLGDGFVGGLLASDEVVGGVELGPVVELLGQGAARVSQECVGDADQSVGGAFVSQGGAPEVGLTEVDDVLVHWPTPADASPNQ